MFKKKLMTGIMLAAFALTPAMVMAEDASSPSYANKKSGKVAFKSDESAEQVSEVAVTGETPEDVAGIEPAAGADVSDEAATSSEGSSLAESMKLPRK